MVEPRTPVESPVPLAHVTSSATFKALVQERSRLSWILSAIICAIFFGYITLIAFDHDLLGAPIGAGWTITIGIPVGLGVILAGIALTALYVRRANTRFDRLTRALREEVGQ